MSRGAWGSGNMGGAKSLQPPNKLRQTGAQEWMLRK